MKFCENTFLNEKPLNWETELYAIENYQSVRFYMGSNFKDPEVSIHIPFIGAGLAGGDWDKIEDLIEHNWDEQEVYVYKFKG